MPGNLAVPTVIGSARRCRSGNSMWTFRHCAWNVAKRSVIARNFSRTAAMCSRPFFKRKSARLLEQILIPQEGGELFVLLEEGVFEVGPEDVMAVLNLL